MWEGVWFPGLLDSGPPCLKVRVLVGTRWHVQIREEFNKQMTYIAVGWVSGNHRG